MKLAQATKHTQASVQLTNHLQALALVTSISFFNG